MSDTDRWNMARQGDPNRQGIAIADDFNIRSTPEDRERTHLETLDLVTKQMTAAVTRCSRDFRYLWVSQAYADWLQCPPDNVIGRPISDVLGTAAFEALLPHF